jgi:DNA-binding beta-propeller fold protein YncE
MRTYKLAWSIFFAREGLSGWNPVNLQRSDQAAVSSLLPMVWGGIPMMRGKLRPRAKCTLLATSAVTGLALSTTVLAASNILPTGMKITPTAAPGSILQCLNPVDLNDQSCTPTAPDLRVDHAVDLALSPDGKTLLALISGYNNYNDQQGQFNPAMSTQYVFVYDVSNVTASTTQVPVLQAIPVDNTFNGIAWNPKLDNDGKPTAFYVSGGVNDNVHVYGFDDKKWVEKATIPLAHTAGVGVDVKPQAAGIAVNPKGTKLLVANYENDSVSLIDLKDNSVAELDLRPGGGQPGGTYPSAVVFSGDNQAYVGSYRDRQLIAISVTDDNKLAIKERIDTNGQPNKMILNHDRTRLYVACDNSDTVLVVDTANEGIIEEIPTTAPGLLVTGTDKVRLKGANPNNLALSPDQGTLFVSEGGLNAIAVIQLGQEGNRSDENHPLARRDVYVFKDTMGGNCCDF